MNVQLREIVNSYLDKLVRPEFHAFHRSWSAYKVCGYTGETLLTVAGMTMAMYLDLSIWVVASLILLSAMTFLGLTMATKILIGEERIVYYHHEIAILMVVIILLRFLQQPILPYLDMTILGVGVFLICGRIGCFMVGCCHGRPHHWGVCYREEHAIAGFTSFFVGVRLFPIQAVESVYVLGSVLVGGYLVMSNHPPGEALAWYIITYDIGRFFFEFMRGDPGRPYYVGFSEGQWISILLMCFVVWAELYGIITFHLWHACATATLVLTMITVVLIRCFRRTAKHKLLHPRHVKEVAEAIELISKPKFDKASISKPNNKPAIIDIGRTSLGIKISASKVKRDNDCIDHYAISSQNGAMNRETAKTLADIIVQLNQHLGSTEFITGKQGVFHLLIHSQKNAIA